MTTGDANWTDYTYSLKARKLSGHEGFLVIVHFQNGDELHLVERRRLGQHAGGAGVYTRREKESPDKGTPVTVETGRWYDIRIEVEGRKVRCFLDDKLVTEGTQPRMARSTR